MNKWGISGEIWKLFLKSNEMLEIKVQYQRERISSSFMSNLDIEDYVNLNTDKVSKLEKQIGKDKERTEQSTKHPRVVGKCQIT